MTANVLTKTGVIKQHKPNQTFWVKQAHALMEQMLNQVVV